MTQTPAGWLPAPNQPGQLRYWDGMAWTEHFAPAGAPRPQILSDQKAGVGMAVLAWAVAVCTLGYMLPWAIAESRGKANSGAIALVNLLLGWTLIGWIVALVMACGAHQRFAV